MGRGGGVAVNDVILPLAGSSPRFHFEGICFLLLLLLFYLNGTTASCLVRVEFMTSLLFIF